MSTPLRPRTLSLSGRIMIGSDEQMKVFGCEAFVMRPFDVAKKKNEFFLVATITIDHVTNS